MEAILKRVQKDPIVKRHTSNLKEGDDLPKRALDAALAIKREYDTSGRPLSSEAREFIVYARDTFRDTVEQKTLVCKPPLQKSDLTFNDIAGQTEAKRDIRNNYIRPYTFSGIYKEKSKGVMFYGPPGTGKTMLAKAATAEIPGALFFAPSPGELKGKYEGETEKAIANVFDCAQRASEESGDAPAIVFIDEFDSLAGSRGDDPGMRRSVNSLLQAMDGIVTKKGTSVIAASNYPWDIDDAILSRFSARVFVDLPDAIAREWLIRSSLMSNYSSPASKPDVRTLYNVKTKEWDSRYFAIMKKYYNNSCTKDIVGGLFGGGQKDDILSAENIGKFVNATGPNDEGKAILTRIQSAIVEPSEVTPSTLFGYSARDITKLMNVAVSIAADRALLGMFKKVLIGGKTYYVSCDENDPKAKYSVVNPAAGDIIPREEYPNILNFSLCTSDMEEALRRYPPTIRGDLYVRLLNYKIHGYSTD